MSRHETEVSSSRRRRRGVVAPLALLLVGLCGSAAVQAQVSVPPAGRLLASNCFQCHGSNGKGPGFEQINGKSVDEIYKELREMQAGKEGQGLMTRHAMGYSDAQLRAISQWLSTQR
jgi:cytochrome c553